jgi:hypothetical protein
MRWRAARTPCQACVTPASRCGETIWPTWHHLAAAAAGRSQQLDRAGDGRNASEQVTDIGGLRLAWPASGVASGLVQDQI